MSKHARAKAESYWNAHQNNLAQLMGQGFVLDHDLQLSVVEQTSFLCLSGHIRCSGDLSMRVEKIIEVSEVAGVPYWKTIKYTYNLTLQGRGVVFRYDNAHVHDSQPSPHHKHTFSPPGQNETITHTPDWPTLGEALREAQEYFWGMTAD